jgi:hypothetical protein
MTTFCLPKAVDVQQMLGMLYSDGFSVKSGSAVSADLGSKSLVAVYVDDDNKPVTACVSDYPFTAFAGGALTRIPKGGAEDMASSGDFSEMILSNVYEIMNICSRLFMDSNTPHLRLDRSYSKPDLAPDDVRAMLSSTKARADFEVTIPGYGNGKLSFLST